jgi:hypothetical protein
VWMAIAAILLLSVGGGSLFVWKIINQPRSRLGGFPISERTMPDGTVLVLEQITTKKPHELKIPIAGGPMIKSIFPGAATANTRQMYAHALDESVIIWLSRWHPNLPDSQDFDWWLASVLIDEHGEEILDSHETSHVLLATGGSSSSGSARPWSPVKRAKNDILVVTSQFPALRQAAGNRQMRVYDRSGQQVAEFEVPFPDTSATPVWRPDPLPVTKTDGDVRVTFTAVEMQEQPPLKLAFPLKHPRRGWKITPVFNVERNGMPAPGWKSDSMTLTDALGNTGYLWNCTLSPFEAAWKLEMTLSRDDPGAFSPDERWDSPLVSLPAADTSQPINPQATPTEAKVQQVTVTLQAIGRGSMKYTEFVSSRDGMMQRSDGPRRLGTKSFGVGHSSSTRDNGPTIHSLQIHGECAHLLVKMEHVPAGHRELFRVYDDQGRELPHGVDSFTIGDTYYGFVFVDPAADAQSLRLTAYVHTSRKVELLLAPPVISASGQSRPPSLPAGDSRIRP